MSENQGRPDGLVGEPLRDPRRAPRRRVMTTDQGKNRPNRLPFGRSFSTTTCGGCGDVDKAYDLLGEIMPSQQHRK